MNRKKYLEKRRKFRDSALSDKKKFLGQGEKKILECMRYFRGLCLGEIDYLGTRAKTLNQAIQKMRISGGNEQKREAECELALCRELAIIRKRESASVRGLLEKKDFPGFLKFLERLDIPEV